MLAHYRQVLYTTDIFSVEYFQPTVALSIDRVNPITARVISISIHQV